MSVRPTYSQLRKFSRLRVIALGLLALAVAALAATIWKRQLPPQEIDFHSPALRHFVQHQQELEAIFLGSSRFVHHIKPAQFDARVSALTGQTIRSLNLSREGMWPPESFFVLRSLLATKPTHLRWIFLELMEIDPNLNPEVISSSRIAAWHDLQHSQLAWKAALARNDHSSLPLLSSHFGIFLNQWFLLGQGSDLLAERLLLPEKKRRKPSKLPSDWIANAGFQPGPDRPLAGPALEIFPRQVAAIAAQPHVFPLSALLRSELDKLDAEVRASGAQLVLVLAPTLTRRELFSELPNHIPCLSFNDPNTFPELYRPEVRYDAGHLNPTGAQVFTDLLASRFAPLLTR